MADPLFNTYLTAPWKAEYVKSEKGGDGCLFCRIAEKDGSVIGWEVFRDEKIMVLLNRFPYNPGHLLIVPIEHVEEFDQLPEEMTLIILKTIQKMISVLKKSHQATSFNIGLNQGPISGASIAHLHWHVVPRFPTDSNYMEMLGTRTLIETLSQTLSIIQSILNI